MGIYTLDLRQNMKYLCYSRMKNKKSTYRLKEQDFIDQWSVQLNCPKCLLRYCLNKVGNSYNAVEAYWTMNKDWLLDKYERENQKIY